jgi:hypothetical protein
MTEQTAPEMDNPPQPAQVPFELKEALAESRSLTREQLSAAWQLHLDRVREQLDSNWREPMDHIFNERFAEIEARLNERFGAVVEEHTKAAVTEAAGWARTAAQVELTDQLNQTARRLKHAETREAWIRTMLEAAGNFCGRAALFKIAGRNLKFEGGLGIGEDREADFPIASAPAFASAIDSRDSVVAVATRGELSEAAVDLFGDVEGRKVYLFPMVMRQMVVGVLYAEPGADPINVSALELVTTLAVNSIEEEVVTVEQRSDNLIRISSGEPAGILPAPQAANGQAAMQGSWSLLPKTEQEIHLRAQRFARSQVANLLLYKAQQVKSGRASQNLYATLKEEIDAGREDFRRQFMSNCPSMADYYHLELVGTLARNDNGLLGADYPGPLS